MATIFSKDRHSLSFIFKICKGRVGLIFPSTISVAHFSFCCDYLRKWEKESEREQTCAAFSDHTGRVSDRSGIKLSLVCRYRIFQLVCKLSPFFLFLLHLIVIGGGVVNSAMVTRGAAVQVGFAWRKRRRPRDDGGECIKRSRIMAITRVVWSDCK